MGKKLIGKSKSDKHKCPLSPDLKNAGGSWEGSKAAPQPRSSLPTEPPVCRLAPTLAVKGEKHQQLVILTPGAWDPGAGLVKKRLAKLRNTGGVSVDFLKHSELLVNLSSGAIWNQ